MSEPIEVVVFSKMGGPLTKRITLTADGKIASDGSACTMARGRAKRKRIGCVGELAALIEDLTSEQAIALGALRDDLPDEIGIVTKAALANGPINGAVARTGDNFVYRPGRPALALFDYDLKGMPGEVAQRVAAAGAGRPDRGCRVWPLQGQDHVGRRRAAVHPFLRARLCHLSVALRCRWRAGAHCPN